MRFDWSKSYSQIGWNQNYQDILKEHIYVDSTFPVLEDVLTTIWIAVINIFKWLDPLCKGCFQTDHCYGHSCRRDFLLLLLFLLSFVIFHISLTLTLFLLLKCFLLSHFYLNQNFHWQLICRFVNECDNKISVNYVVNFLKTDLYLMLYKQWSLNIP